MPARAKARPSPGTFHGRTSGLSFSCSSGMPLSSEPTGPRSLRARPRLDKGEWSTEGLLSDRPMRATERIGEISGSHAAASLPYGRPHCITRPGSADSPGRRPCGDSGAGPRLRSSATAGQGGCEPGRRRPPSPGLEARWSTSGRDHEPRHVRRDARRGALLAARGARGHDRRAAARKPRVIYLDHNATTPIDPAVVEAMLPYLREHFGNPSSGHAARTPAPARPSSAPAPRWRPSSARRPAEIVFTSGGSEANTMADAGRGTRRGPGHHVVTSAVEHPAVLEPCRVLEDEGYVVTRVDGRRAGPGGPRGRDGRRARRHRAGHGDARQQRGRHAPTGRATSPRPSNVRVHTDAAQAVGKIPVGRRRPRRGPAHRRRSQALRTEGRGRALRARGRRPAAP